MLKRRRGTKHLVNYKKKIILLGSALFVTESAVAKFIVPDCGDKVDSRRDYEFGYIIEPVRKVCTQENPGSLSPYFTFNRFLDEF
jgi:hypothetical protein